MKHQTLRSVFISVALLLVIITAAPHPAHAANWTIVRSKNFTLVGNGSDRYIRQVANRLEQFRTVFASLFPDSRINAAVPTTVIVFKSDSSFKPYKFRNQEAGYFQSGEDVNYIALSSDQASENQPLRIIFHEYVHVLVNNMMGTRVPLWFNEGLAEYYSTFDIINERSVLLGSLIPQHVNYLRMRDLLPLRALFAVDYASPYYNESTKMNIFYAESWMFIHYLLQADGQKHRPQLKKFLDLLRAGGKVDDAFKQAFQSNIDAVEKDFRAYIQTSRFVGTSLTFEQKVDNPAEMKTASLSDADAHAYLGDLLLHTHRLQEAETELQQALALDDDSLLAHTALAMMRIRQGQMSDARPHLVKALKGNADNYLLHYYYAYALSDLNMNEHRVVSNYPEDVAETMRRELKQTIALKPDYAESYWLFGFVNLVRNEQIDESIELLKQGLAATSNNQRIMFMLAQLDVRKERFAEAQELLSPIAQTSADADLREQAGNLAAAIDRGEKERVKILEELKKYAPVGKSDRQNVPPVTPPAAAPAVAPGQDEMNTALADALRTPGSDEKRVQGLLTLIDCNGKGIVFQVRAGDRLLKFHRDNFDHMVITAFTTGIGREIDCGPRKPENWIVLTYTTPNPGAKSDGEVVAIEFVPKTFELKP